MYLHIFSSKLMFYMLLDINYNLIMGSKKPIQDIIRIFSDKYG